MAANTFYQELDSAGNILPIYMAEIGLISQPGSAGAKTYHDDPANAAVQFWGVNRWNGSAYVPVIGATCDGTVTINGFSNTAAIAAAYQPLASNLTSLAGLTYASASFVKMTAAGTFALDTTAYQTALTNPVTGTSTSTYVSYWTGANTQSGNANFAYNGTTILTTPHIVSATTATYSLGSSGNFWLNTYTSNVLGNTGAGQGIKIGDVAHPLLIQTDGVNNGVGIGGAPSASFMLNVTGSISASYGISCSGGNGIATGTATLLNGGLIATATATIGIGGGKTFTTALDGVQIGRWNNTTTSTFSGAAGVVQVGTSLYNIVNQSSTASFTAFKIVTTETAVGSGAQRVIDVYVGAAGTTNIFSVSNKGIVMIGNLTTAAAAGLYAIGLMYFDTTLNKLRIGGATAWETVTSI